MKDNNTERARDDFISVGIIECDSVYHIAVPF